MKPGVKKPKDNKLHLQNNETDHITLDNKESNESKDPLNKDDNLLKELSNEIPDTKNKIARMGHKLFSGGKVPILQPKKVFVDKKTEIPNDKIESENNSEAVTNNKTNNLNEEDTKILKNYNLDYESITQSLKNCKDFDEVNGELKRLNNNIISLTLAFLNVCKKIDK